MEIFKIAGALHLNALQIWIIHGNRLVEVLEAVDGVLGSPS